MHEPSIGQARFRAAGRARLTERRAADLFYADLLGGHPASHPFEGVAEQTDAGEQAVHVPLLRAHQAPGARYDLSAENCMLRWARVPSGYRGTVDVVVHFHGYKRHNRMTLRNKADLSGLDLDLPGVSRPTLGLVPHGRAFPSTTQPGVDGFSFPAIDDRAGLFRLVEAGLGELGRLVGSSSLRRGRLVLTGHSGGGAALNRLMRALGDAPDVHGFHYYDASYGGTELITGTGSWLNAALERDARALSRLGSEWARYMDENGSHLRLVGIAPSGTAAVARQVEAFLERRVRALLSDPGQRQSLRRYYRAQRVVVSQPDLHNRVPGLVGGRLLAFPGHDLDGIAGALTSARPSRGAPVRATEQNADAAATPGALYRAKIVEALEHWKGAVEGDAKFTRFRSPATLEAARKAAGRRGSAPYTTCIEFLLQVQADAARAAGRPVRPVDARVWDRSYRDRLPPGAWQGMTPGSSARPKPGDVLYLIFARNVRNASGRVIYHAGAFSHVGFFLRREAMPANLVSATHPADTELWYTVDGGQGRAGKYDAQGNLLVAGQERIDEVRRFYHPADCQISGEQIQGDRDYRTLLGWVDVEQLASAAGR